MAMLLRIDDLKIVFSLVLMASVGGLASALAGQYVFGFDPCVLCLYQRVPWAAAAAMALVALTAGLGRQSGWPVLACALAFAAGSLLALYHVGVQEHWWASVTGCAGAPVGGVTLDDLRPGALARPLPPCDRVDFRLLGLSLAGWNAVLSALLATACLFGFRALKQRHQP